MTCPAEIIPTMKSFLNRANTAPPRRVQDAGSSPRQQSAAWRLFPITVCLIVLASVTISAAALQGRDLSATQQAALKKRFTTILGKWKGPYTKNYCVCKDGTKAPVLGPDGKIRNACGSANTVFCGALRTELATVLGRQEGMYLGNFFSRDLHFWKRFPDHHNLIRGYILEKYFTETHPSHKLAQLRSYRGLTGSEYEARDMPRFFERYLALSSFNDYRHFLLAYELQKRFFVRNDQGQIQKARRLATRIQTRDAAFKPLRDATHNQITAALIPKLAAYRDQRRKRQDRAQVDALIAEIEKLTSLDEEVLKAQVAEMKNSALRRRLRALLPARDDNALSAVAALAELMAQARRMVAQREVSPAAARRLIELTITAAAVMQRRGTAFLEAGTHTVKQYVHLLVALTNASYGVGLLSECKHLAAIDTLRQVLATPTLERAAFARQLKQAKRIVEWAQDSALLAFAEVRGPWTFLLPDTALIGDDILRGSPLLLFGRVAARLGDHIAGQNPVRHEIFGAYLDRIGKCIFPIPEVPISQG